MNLVKQNPKKAMTLFTLPLLIFILYKQRQKVFQFTFDQTIQRMSAKIQKSMQEKIEKVQKYNKTLEQLQDSFQSFYKQGQYKTNLLTIMNSFQIQEIKTILKGLDKNASDFTQQRKQTYQQLNNAILIFAIQTIILYRTSECLLYLIQVKCQQYQDNEITSIFTNTQLSILQQQSQYIQNIVQQYLLNNQNLTNFEETQNSLTILQEIVNSIKQIKIQYKEIKQKTQQQINNFIENKKRIVQENADHLKLNELKKSLIKKLDQIFNLNQSVSILTFQQYSKQFIFQKLENRVFLLQQSKNIIFPNEVLLKQLFLIEKIIQEEIYDKQADENNEQFYKLKLKLALAPNFKGEDPELLNRILHEYRLKEILQESQIQISRKLIFEGEIEDDVMIETNSLGY